MSYWSGYGVEVVEKGRERGLREKSLVGSLGLE